MVFVHDHGGNAGLADLFDDAPDLHGNQRRQTLGGLIQNQQIGVGHERAANSEHLLLATRELPATVVDALAQTRESLHDAVERPLAPPIDTGACRHLQVFAHRQALEDAAPFGHIGNALLGDLVGARLAAVIATHQHAAMARTHHAQHALDERGLAHAVAPHQGNALAFADMEVDAVQDVAGTVVGVDFLGFKQHVRHGNSPPSPDRPVARPRWP